MKLELTIEQYNLIQDEIIRLEEEFKDTRDQLDGWDIQNYQVEIATLKQILHNEYIDIKPYY
jgi:hypothetical protein